MYVPPFTLEILQQRKCLRDKQKTYTKHIHLESIHPSIHIHPSSLYTLPPHHRPIHQSIHTSNTVDSTDSATTHINYCRYHSFVVPTPPLILCLYAYFSKRKLSASHIPKTIFRSWPMDKSVFPMENSILATTCSAGTLHSTLSSALLCFQNSFFGENFSMTFHGFAPRAPTKA